MGSRVTFVRGHPSTAFDIRTLLRTGLDNSSVFKLVMPPDLVVDVLEIQGELEPGRSGFVGYGFVVTA